MTYSLCLELTALCHCLLLILPAFSVHEGRQASVVVFLRKMHRTFRTALSVLISLHDEYIDVYNGAAATFMMCNVFSCSGGSQTQCICLDEQLHEHHHEDKCK